jgi:uncharacterized protein YegL
MSAVIPDLSLSVNKSERLPCVLIVDGSSSMANNNAISSLNEGLTFLAQALKEDDDTAIGVQIAVIAMGGEDEIRELTPFVDASEFTAPVVKANGRTPLGKAVDHAMAMIEAQKQKYRQNAIPYKRPWLWIMSDGAPTDAWESVAVRAQAAQTERHFILWAIGIGKDVPLQTMMAFTTRERCFRLGERNIKDMFEWFSASAAAGARAKTSEQAALPPLPAFVETIETW